MKLDWQVEGTVCYTNSAVEAYSAAWPGLTHAECSAKVEQLVAEYIKKREVSGVNVIARAHGKAGRSLIQKAQWK